MRLRASLAESPQEIALSYTNDLAFACGMIDILKHSYFVGAFSE